jgi:hypothetical protein
MEPGAPSAKPPIYSYAISRRSPYTIPYRAARSGASSAAARSPSRPPNRRSRPVFGRGSGSLRYPTARGFYETEPKRSRRGFPGKPGVTNTPILCDAGSGRRYSSHPERSFWRSS